METLDYAPPQPSVEHLTTIFRKILNGSVRFPAFQRDFVWGEKQIIDLLESVYESYPIGSLLLWQPREQTIKIKEWGFWPIKIDAKSGHSQNFVLDGMQRLTSLFGVFYYDNIHKDERFNVGFDLDKSIFCKIEKKSKFTDPRAGIVMPLSYLFDTRKMLKFQSDLSSRGALDRNIDKLIKLQSAFQEYMVPVVTISDSDISRVVRVFEKINSSGTALSSIDFMRAITWAQDFDLSSEIDNISSGLAGVGFEIPDETLVKSAAIALKLPVTAAGLAELRNTPVSNLKEAFGKVEHFGHMVVSFLRQQIGIRSYDLVPYEGQFLVLFKYMIEYEALGSEDLDVQFAQWLFVTSLNEAFRGKPDHYVDRAVSDIKSAVSGNVRGLETQLKLTSEDFRKRKLMRTRSLSSAFVMAIYLREAKDLKTGAKIFPLGVTWGEFSSALVPILPEESTGREAYRTFANLAVSNTHSFFGSDGHLFESVLECQDYEWLVSQFINQEAYDCLTSGDVDGFLKCRAEALYEFAKLATAPPTPPTA